MGDYNSIINYEYHGSDKRPHMSMYKRAAQFLPFAALTGYGEAIKEAGRLTEHKRELSDTEAEELNRKLALINAGIRNTLSVTVTYFVPDSRKDGGEYRSFTGEVKKIDTFKGEIVFLSGERVPVSDISDIEITGYNDGEGPL
ncbi:MAG: YolD-like family protein [Parasporobacterium sp.]|nr:YolD-like family protein [Parasporobacterium sp.]